MIDDKLPPYSTEAEEVLIGSLLIDDQCMIRLTGLVEGKDFFRESNQWAFDACKAIYERGEGINQITVADELNRVEKLEMVGGAAYLAHCVAVTPTSLHADWYAGIVKRTATMRRLIQAGGRIAAIGYEDGAVVETALSQAQGWLDELREGTGSAGYVPLRGILENCIEEMTIPKDKQREGARIPTGFKDLDQILGGMHPSDLIVLAARPSMGKTSLCLNIAEQVALNCKCRVGIVSLEMSRDQLAYRLIASHAGVNLQNLLLSRIGYAEQARVTDSLGMLSEVAIFVDDAAGQKISDIRAKAKQLSMRHGIDLLVVDYLGLAHGSGRSQNRVQEIGEITRGLKSLARELNVPVLLAAQLSRAVEQRTPHIPMLSDLRESGEIEQDADVVMFIYREDAYTNEDEWLRHNPTKPYPKGIADIIVAKHRNGPVGQCSLLFHAAITRFMPLDLYRQEPPVQGRYWQT